jgi:hypothetical protein
MFSAGLSSSCTTVPSLSEATGSRDSPIYISEVVKRVKCEIADRLADKVITDNYAWMKDWTAKIDMTFQVNDQAGVTPTVAYTRYYRNAFNFGAGSTSLTQTMIASVAQSLSFGVGANYGEQAIRADVESFTLSLRELANWKYPPKGISSDYGTTCPRPTSTIEFNNDLGLKAWADSALYPVSTSDLRAGRHPSPVNIQIPAIPAAGAFKITRGLFQILSTTKLLVG